MKYHTFLFFLILPFLGFAQTPSNDDCSGLVDVGQVPYCNSGDVYDNVNATASDIGYGNLPVQCNASVNTAQDVWFEFTTSDTIVDYSIIVTGVENGMLPAMQNPVVIIYRGDCAVDGLLEIGCAVADVGASSVELQFNGLSIGTNYFLRIFDANALPDEAGAFELCIDEIRTDFDITQGSTTASEGTIFDTGGDTGNYGNNENEVFTICPAEFHQCLTFTLNYYNLETGDPFYGDIGDVLNFYDGPDTQSPLITSVGGAPLGYYFFNATTTDGGVCYSIQATSGCLTLEFISDEMNTYEGFSGSWEVSLEACTQNQSISTNENINTGDIEGLLTSPESTVSVKNITCASGAYGTFQAGDNTDLGLENGLILSTGFIDDAEGPNTTEDIGGFYDGDLYQPGDNDLDELSDLFGDGIASQDACVVELEVFAATNELNFEYVFGSDEYPEFVGGGFNDIFAFLISGPGITGIPQLNNQDNIAILPNIGDPVQIDNVNNVTNWQFYRNNNTIYNESTEFDGLTSDYLGSKKSLTARATVEPCNTYTLKLAIADRGDGAYNSAVFIGEITGGQPEIVFNSFLGLDEIIEDCSGMQDSVIIDLIGEVTQATTYQVQISGTATRDEDYILDMPDILTINPGDESFSFSIIPLADNLDEDTETIIIDLISDFGCGSFNQGTVTIEIKDQVDIVVDVPQDTLSYCQGNTLTLSASGAAEYIWTPVGIIDNPIQDTVNITPTESGWVTVTGQVGVCSASDSVYINFIESFLSLTPSTPTTICNGESVELELNTNLEGTIEWSPSTGVLNPDSNNPVLSPTQSTTYTASVADDGGCVAVDQITVTVENLDVPILIDDTAICLGDNIALASINTTSQPVGQYEWTPAASIIDPSSPTPIASPTTTTTYSLTASSTSGACQETGSVTIEVVDPLLELTFTEASICNDESIELSVLNEGSYQWSPSESLSCSDCPNPIASPSESQIYTVTIDNGSCVFSGDVNINVAEGVFLGLSTNPTGNDLLAGCPVDVLVSNNSDTSLVLGAYEWTVNGQSLPDTESTINFVMSEENYLVDVNATADNGCSGSTSISFSPNIYTPSLPNVFTPNGDELNDRFNFIDECLYPVLRFDVYNRWGQLVYENDTPDLGWDGRFNDKDVSQDVYIYIIELELPNGIETFQGDVTVLR